MALGAFVATIPPEGILPMAPPSRLQRQPKEGQWLQRLIIRSRNRLRAGGAFPRFAAACSRSRNR